MKKLYLLLVFSLFISKVDAQKDSSELKILSLRDLQEEILYTDAPLTIFNFWATWCAPCVKELPYFEEINNQDANVIVKLVNLDFKKDLEKVKQFLNENNLNSEVFFLDEKDPDYYMTKISPDWTGAIPASLFVTDLGRTYFHEKAFSKEELSKTVNKYLNN